jgi:GNAT superfamily N-acetyltransferase
MAENVVKLDIGGESVTIRPLHATDVAMEAEFVRQLSAQTRRNRFFGSIKELSDAELKLLCDVDGQRSVALVATTRQNGQETAIGVSRYAPSQVEGAREMALTVADEWQYKGLGDLLMAQLIDHAKANGVKELYSVELAENDAMRRLAQKIGMHAHRDPEDAAQIIYSLTL